MKLFVGNLPFSVGDEELNEMFSAHGSVVSARVIVDRETGRSRGFGFVEFSNNDEAEEAMNALNGTDQAGRTIVVNQAHENDRGGRRPIRQ